jgi:hypothetical protein
MDVNEQTGGESELCKRMYCATFSIAVVWGQWGLGRGEGLVL